MALIKFRWIQRINKNATTKLASRLQFVFPLIYLERWRKWNREEQNIHEINQKKHLYFDVVKNCHSIKFSRLLFWAGEYGKYLIPFEPIRLQDFRIRTSQWRKQIMWKHCAFCLRSLVVETRKCLQGCFNVAKNKFMPVSVN